MQCKKQERFLKIYVTVDIKTKEILKLRMSNKRMQWIKVIHLIKLLYQINRI